MKRLLVLPLLVLCACFDKLDDTADDFFVHATIDGEAYTGDVEGAHLFSSEPAWLLLFPSDELQGSIYGWSAGETGSWDTVFEEACEDDCTWLQYQLGSATYVSAAGTITIDSWTDHAPENEFDARIGFARGGFEGSLACWMGCEGAAETVEITDGAFYVQVTTDL
jgi:hypothetical protein